MYRHSGCAIFLARLGATRGGSPGIFGYTGGQAASGSPAAVSRSCIARSGSSHVSGDGFWFDLSHRLAAASKDFGVSGRATGVAERDASIEPTVLRSRDAAIEQRVSDGAVPGSPLESKRHLRPDVQLSHESADLLASRELTDGAAGT